MNIDDAIDAIRSTVYSRVPLKQARVLFDHHETILNSLFGVKNALAVAEDGVCDGDHHKMWVIDQMVRALCRTEEVYNEWVAAFCDGEDGPDTYEWEEGIAP